MKIILCTKENQEDSLMHYRVSIANGGSPNGVRQWQNKDGSYTPAGYKHYAEMYGWGKNRKKVEDEPKKSERQETKGQKSIDEKAMLNDLSKIKYKEFSTLMSPEQVQKEKAGSCHDMVMYEYAKLKKKGIQPKVKFLIEVNDQGQGGATHSFVSYKSNNQTIWLENAWGSNKGIHRYSSESAMMQDVKKRWEKNPEYPILYDGTLNMNKVKPGMNLNDLINCTEFD